MTHLESSTCALKLKEGLQEPCAACASRDTLGPKGNCGLRLGGFVEVRRPRARVCGLFSAVVVFCRGRAAKGMSPPRAHVRAFAFRTLAAHDSDGALLEIPHPPARVGRLSMTGACSKITFVPRGHVRACHSDGTCRQRAEQGCSCKRVPHGARARHLKVCIIGGQGEGTHVQDYCLGFPRNRKGAKLGGIGDRSERNCPSLSWLSLSAITSMTC